MGLHPNSRGIGESESQGGRGTICNVLKRNGIEPAPERSKRTTWSTFLKAHWKVLAASDFFTVEVWTSRGLLTHYVLFVISVAERVVHIAGITTRPGEAWMLQVGRNLIDEESGALASKRYLIIDRDTKYTQQFRRLVEEGGTEVIRLPPMSPNLNAYAERFVRSIKDECLNRMIFIGQASLRRAIGEYMAHYHEERNHQGLENRLIRPAPRHAANAAFDSTPPTTRRNAQLLLPRSSVRVPTEFLDITGTAASVPNISRIHALETRTQGPSVGSASSAGGMLDSATETICPLSCAACSRRTNTQSWPTSSAFIARPRPTAKPRRRILA